jgi:hypothetical protein
MLQRHERLLKAGHRFPIGRVCSGLGPGLSAVGQRFVPRFAPQGMMRQPFDLLVQPVAHQRFQGRDNACMEDAAPLVQEAAVRYCVRQGVLEGICALWKQTGFVEKLSGLHVRQTMVQHLIGRVGNGLQQRPGDLRANDRGGLEQAFVVRWQPVNAGCQNCLHRGGDLQALQRLGQPIGATLATRTPVSTRVRTLSSRKKGLSWVRANQELFERFEAGVIPQQGLEQLVSARRGSGSSRSCV